MWVNPHISDLNLRRGKEQALCQEDKTICIDFGNTYGSYGFALSAPTFNSLNMARNPVQNLVPPKGTIGPEKRSVRLF